jgi:hypothetical protein
MTLLAFTTLTLLPPQAYAGHYTVSYSGGNCNGQPYTFNNGVYGGGASANNQNPNVTCSGQITATFTWVPDPSIPNEPPPPAAVVMQNCTAQWQCNAPNAKSAQGSADNGLGFTPITVGNGTTQVGQSSSGVMYLIKTPAAGSDLSNFTVTCTPSASITIPVPFMGQAGAGITYSATATPLMVVLGGSGINLNTQPEYLIGQQVNCSLNPGGLTPSNYQWAPPASCQPFKQWLRTNYFQGNSDQPQTGQLILLANQDLTQSTLTFYPKVPTNDVVTCTVDLAVPAGAHPVGGFPGTAVTSLQIAFEDPELYQFNVAIEPQNDPRVDNQGVFADLNTGKVELDRINFNHAPGSKVKTPLRFIPPGSEDKGVWGTCQLLTPNIVGIALPPPNQNNQQGLDNWFPEGNFEVPANGDILQNGFIDTPFIGPVNNNVGNFSVTENFVTTMMYLPPPQSTSQWVPLQNVTWLWNAAMTFQNGAWVLLQSRANEFNGAVHPPFPQWQNIFVNFGAFGWTTFPNGGIGQ